VSGTVSSSGGQRISGATVRVIDGVDTGKTATTNSNGEYRFDSLTIANVNFSATASGYQEDRRGTFVNGTNTLNFTLAPIPQNPTITLTATEFIRTVGYAEWKFLATGSNATFRNWSWEFGDGNSANSGRPDESHNYFAEGEYTVKVTAQPVGSSNTVTATITIKVTLE
jgi:PKD repeat protein